MIPPPHTHTPWGMRPPLLPPLQCSLDLGESLGEASSYKSRLLRFCDHPQKEEERVPQGHSADHGRMLAAFSLSNQGGLAWKGSKDNNQEREGTKTGDNPGEI